ncbi:MAG TPA: hypothetical protein V6D16_17440 [Candidatus Obscuribacterales bacterium]
MSLPPLHPPANPETYVRGDVTIHSSVAIAPGVLIQAEPNSRIIINAGVCIGMGSVLHAYEGTLELREGVNLGAGVLVIGEVTIGANACIGSSATLFNCEIEAGQLIPSGSVHGDSSRQVALENGLEANPKTTSEPTTHSQLATPTATSTPAETTTPSQATSEAASEATSKPTPDQSALATKSPEAAPTQVYGQAYLNRLLGTLLPHRQALNQPINHDD